MSFASCVQRQVPCLRSAVAAHQQSRLHPCRGAEFDPRGFSVRENRDSLLPYTRWSTSLLHWSCDFHSCRLWGGQSCSHSRREKSSRLDVVVFHVVTQRLIPTVQLDWRTIEISQLQFASGGRCPCCAGRAGLLVPS